MPAQEKKSETPTSTLKKEKPENEKVQVVKPEPLKTLLTWSASERPFKRRSREFFTTAGAFIFLTGVILLFIKEWLLILVMIALVFVVYILATVEPRKVEHKITNRGIITGKRRYNWEELGRFWFTEKFGNKILHIETLFGLSRRLLMLLGETKQEQVEKILSDYLLFEEPEKTWIDRSSEWVSQRVPLETPS